MSTRGPSIAPRTSLAPSPAGTGTASSPEGMSPPGTVTAIVTSREWVLPPRPKPGRKPSVDTPVSKRKAQNRAAQRAFRERRATRVQELEQQLLEVEKEKEAKEMGLVSTINKLKFENSVLSKSVEQLRQEFNILRGSLMSPPASVQHPQTKAKTQAPGPLSPHASAERVPARPQQTLQSRHGSTTVASAVDVGVGATSAAATAAAASTAASNAYKADINHTAQQLLNFAKSSPIKHNSVSPASSSYSVQQISPAPSADSPGAPISRHSYTPHDRKVPSSNEISTHSQNLTAKNDFDCGVCTKDECLCADIGLKTIKAEEIDYTSFEPVPAVSLRRKRKQDPVEIDFTAQFSSKKMPDLKRLRKPSSGKVIASSEIFNEDSPMENCGFCSDDTPCVCREAAKEAARIKELSNIQDYELNNEYIKHEEEVSTSLPPIQTQHPTINRKFSLPVMHPGPTFELRDIPNIPTNNAPPAISREPPETSRPQEPTNVEESDKSGCTGNPGTCSQCQTDPMSTLFCSTVASKAAQENDAGREQAFTTSTKSNGYLNSPQPSSSGERSTSGSGSTNPSTPQAITPGGGSNGIFIPCADAYRTLSRHKRFNAIDFSSLVGRLTTRGMQVEVQSVANVLRELDKKVYD